MHIASSDDAYAPLATDWSADDAAERAATWAGSLGGENRLVLVAEGADGAVIGFVTGGPARRPEPNAEFEIYAIHVCPTHRGRGVGHALWIAACRDLRGLGACRHVGTPAVSVAGVPTTLAPERVIITTPGAPAGEPLAPLEPTTTVDMRKGRKDR